MLTRKDLEELGIVMTDEQWETFNKQQSDLQDRMWEEEHPLDE